MTAGRDDIASLPTWPRRLSREQAAAYCGVSPALFDRRVEAKLLPQAIAWGNRRLWDRPQLDAALDAELGLARQSTPAGTDAGWYEAQ